MMIFIGIFYGIMAVMSFASLVKVVIIPQLILVTFMLYLVLFSKSYGSAKTKI